MAKVEQIPSGSIGRQTLGRHLLGDSQINVLPDASVYQRTERYGGIVVSNPSPLPTIFTRKQKCFQQIIGVNTDPQTTWQNLPATLSAGNYILACDVSLFCFFQEADLILQGHSYAGSSIIAEIFVAGLADPFTPYRLDLFIDPGDFLVGGPIDPGAFPFIRDRDTLTVPTFPTNLTFHKNWHLRLLGGPVEITSGSLQLR